MFGDLRTLNSLDKVIKFQNNNKQKKFKIIYCPPSTLIRPLSKRLKKTKIEVGAQNCHESDKFGPFTGQINSKMLKNVGAKYIIIGHSENRQDGDDNKKINLKIKNALKVGLKIIFCIGETLKEKRNKKTNQILSKQILKGLFKINNLNKILIAYEPVWSIGTGAVPRSFELEKNITFIKKILKNKFRIKNPKVLYGGSVNPKNAKNLAAINNIDGFLIGGASQKANNFIDIVKKTII